MASVTYVLFNSIAFLVFFPVVVGLYFALPYRWRWMWLLATSYFFYMYWRAEYALLICGSTVVDFLVAQKMAATDDRAKRLPWLLLSFATNLGLLFTFKYYGFFTDSAVAIASAAGLEVAAPALNLLLPVGISFYTFQTLGYSIDVYKGEVEPERHFGRFALYVSFFPQLVAGPIERAGHLLPQLRADQDFDYDRALDGLQQMTRGMFKKVVVADRLAVYVNSVYADPGSFSGLQLIVATYFFAFQIYCDFSGYTDIAIGAAKVLGIDLMENFRRPYLATSISDFWKRWHISLSTWFRDYLYIPLGGNRVSKNRWYANLFIVFVVSGLWHGANWTFVVWGALHGGYLIGAILTANLREKALPKVGSRRRWVFDVTVTFHLALVAWVFFRANHVTDAFLVFSRSLVDLPEQLMMFATLDYRALDVLMVLEVGGTRLDFVLSLLGVVYVMSSDLGAELVPKQLAEAPWMARMVYYDLLVLGMLLLGMFGQTSFIYFQF